MSLAGYVKWLLSEQTSWVWEHLTPTPSMPISMLSPPHPPMPTKASGDPSAPHPHVLPMNSLASWLPTHQLPGKQEARLPATSALHSFSPRS